MRQNKKLENFSRRLATKAFYNNFFISCTFELTYKCNLRCIHCFNREASKEELSYEKVCEIIDKFINQGCLYFLFTGGEPLIRKDFWDIYIYAKKKGAIITIYTNGTLIDREVIDILIEYPPRKIEISIYGVNKKTHESITKTSGSFEAAMRGISILKSTGIPFSLKTMVMQDNKYELWQMKKLAEEKLGVNFRYDPTILPRIDGNRDNLKYRLSPEEFFEFEKRDKERLNRFKKQWERFNSFPKGKNIYVCSGGKWSCAVDPKGNIKTCIFSSRGFNLIKSTIKDAREKFFSDILEAEWNGDSKCKDCSLSQLCANCPAKAEREAGDIKASVEYLCRLGHLRAKYLNII